MLDVGIVGGGPAGFVTAARLAAGGFRVAVFEEHDTVGRPVHCTGVLAADAIAEFALPREAVLNPLRRVTFVAPDGGAFTYSTERTEAVVIDRVVFDSALAESAARAGAAIERGARVSAIETSANGAEIALEGQGHVSARAVVLACGASYGFQRKFGLGMPTSYLQSAQLELPCERLGDVEIFFGRDVAPSGFAWLVPVLRSEGACVRIGLMAQDAADRYFERFARRIADRWGVVLPPVLEPRRRMLPLGALPQTFADRVLVIGDAAGLVKPTTGGGIYYSIVSARIAAEVLAEALDRDTLDRATLAEYERRWRERFDTEFQAQTALRAIAERFQDRDINDLFELARIDGLLPLVRRTAKFNRHRDLIVELFKYPPSRRILLRRAGSPLA